MWNPFSQFVWLNAGAVRDLVRYKIAPGLATGSTSFNRIRFIRQWILDTKPVQVVVRPVHLTDTHECTGGNKQW